MEKEELKKRIKEVFDSQNFSTRGKRFERVVDEIYFALKRKEIDEENIIPEKMVIQNSTDYHFLERKHYAYKDLNDFKYAFIFGCDGYDSVRDYLYFFVL